MKNKLLFLFLLISFIGYSQNWGEQEIINPNPGTENNYPNNIFPEISSGDYFGDRFGSTVKIMGDYAAISAPGKHEQLGVVHIYKKDANGNWNHLQEIIEHTFRQYSNYFGHSLAINGDYLFVGSLGHRKNEARFEEPAGAVLVYKKDVNGLFVGTQILKSTDIMMGDYFGASVASQGNFLLVGSINDTDENNNNSLNAAGAVYVFELDANGDWQQIQKVVPSVRDRNDYFGYVIDVDGDYFITGSKDKTDVNNQNPSFSGSSAFIFKRNANGVWNETQKIKCSDPDRYGSFATRGISISGDFISISASSNFFENNTWYYGGIFIYKKDANDVWNEQQVLKIANASNTLGTSLAMNDHLLIASDPGYFYFDNGTLIDRTGAVNLFVKDNTDTFIHVDRFLLANPVPFLRASGGAIPYGGSSAYGYNQVGVSGNTFLFGAPNKKMDINGVTKDHVGAAYFSGDVEALGLLAAPLSVTKNQPLTSIKGYPNPTTNNFYINLSKTYENIEVTITNILGKTVFKNSYQQKSALNLQLQNLSKGMYLVKLNVDNKGSKIMKVIKQ